MENCGMTILTIPALLEAARHLPKQGHLVLTENNLLALKIDDAYIHQLYPLLASVSISKPAYFTAQGIGAHISVIYPEEHSNSIDKACLGQQHAFTLNVLVKAKIGHKYYFALTVHAPSLLLLRRQYHLSDQLLFKNCLVDFHITIGVSLC
jgi:hypothetical protein